MKYVEIKCDANGIEYLIHTDTDEECMVLGEKIGNQLRGNPDYINNNIILNYTSGDSIVYLWFAKFCRSIAEITID